MICDPDMQEELDRDLRGAVSFNLAREKGSVWMTTNGMHPIPKFLFPENRLDLPQNIEAKRVAWVLDGCGCARFVFELLLKKPPIEHLVVLCSEPEKEQALFQSEFAPLLKGIELAKELISAPSNLMTPSLFAERCLALQPQGVVVEIFDEVQLKQIGAEALLSVGKGSVQPPRLVVMHYRGADTDPCVFIGKGVCFDAGGIHLKSAYLNEMKWDKAGAGVVVGAIDALSRMRAPVHVIGVVGLAENMPDGGALKPGDVITTLAGKTVEIVDTDCEGRLVLADCLAYVQKNYAPKVMIDLATLTLETFGALGGKYAGLFCADDTLTSALLKAGKAAQEEVWPLPLGDFFAEHIRSKIADLKNAGIERYGASSAAAEFLRAFVNPQIPWAHLDIAGVSWDIFNPAKGVSGFGVRLLVEFCKSLIFK